MTRSQKFILFTALALFVIIYALMNSLRQGGVAPPPTSTNNNRRDFSPKTEVQITDPISIAPKPDGSINTQNWPVYRSTDLGFEIKYPTGWGIKKAYSNEKDVVFSLYFSSVPHDFFVNLTIFTTPLNQIIESESGQNPISVKTIALGNVKSVLQIKRGEKSNPEVSYIFQRGVYTYVMRGLSDLERAMLATLVFIS